MMRQYFQNLAAEVGASEFLLVGDKATLPMNRRTSLSISFAASAASQSKKTISMSKFENPEDDSAPSFPMRKLSSGSLSSKTNSGYSKTKKNLNEPLFNSRWVSTPPLTRSQSLSPVSLTRKHRREHLSDGLTLEIKNVIIGETSDEEEELEEEEELNVRLSPVAPQRKQSIEDCSAFLAATVKLGRSKSAELEALVVPHNRRLSRWSATE